MPIDKVLAEALEDLALESPSDSEDVAEDALVEGYAMLEAGASCSTCVCSCCCCSSNGE